MIGKKVVFVNPNIAGTNKKKRQFGRVVAIQHWDSDGDKFDMFVVRKGDHDFVLSQTQFKVVK